MGSPWHGDLLQRLVDDMCVSSQPSRQHEPWVVTCTLMKQAQGSGVAGQGPSASMKDMWAVAFRDTPDYVYLMNRPDHQVLECEASMLRLLERKLEYGGQMTVRIEGRTYVKGDFLLRLCTATQTIFTAQAVLGHALELEYLPVSHAGVAEPMLVEFVELLRQHLGVLAAQHAASTGNTGAQTLQLEPVRPVYDKYGLAGSAFGRTHAAVAYADLLVHMLNTATQQQAAAAQARKAQEQAAAAGPAMPLKQP